MGNNYSSKILNNAVRALSVQQAVIATTGNNIANVNTPGYTRRVVELQTEISRGGVSGLEIGNGVAIGTVVRQVDEYLQKLVRDSNGDKGSAEVQRDFLSRIESMFSLSGDGLTIGTALPAFFNSINNLMQDPSNIGLRRDMLERATDLVDTIRSSYSQIASLQTEADNRIQSELGVVNSITTQIGNLNGLISQREAGGNPALDERDRRDQLLEDLAEKISFTSIEGSDGSITVMLSNGFPLVSGTNVRQLETTKAPSFATGTLPPSLEGGILNYIVYDYAGSAGDAHLDLTNIIKDGSGVLAGLIEMRGYNESTNTSAFEAEGTLVEIASRIEAISRQLLVDFNQAYLGPDRLSGTAGWQASSGDLDGNSPANFGFFDFEYAGNKDAVDNDHYPELSDLTSATFGIDNYSSILTLAISDPREIAASLDQSGGAVTPVFSPGDGRNLISLADLQNDNTLSFSVGAYSMTGTFGQVYDETVSFVGNAKARAQTNAEVSAENYVVASNRRDAVSAVSLDEEFTSLIKSQKAFEASARMVRTGKELLDEIINLI